MANEVQVIHQMKRGLVIGKFMPLHRGHLALIEFAAGQCDELIVSLSWTTADPIPGALRFDWLRSELAKWPKVAAEISIDDFDNEELPWGERIKLWSAFLRGRFPAIDVIFSSEDYGPKLADELGATHVAFDPTRTRIPVSGTLIRKKPFHYWDFIALSARPYFVRRICFYGPESTGKSTMAKRLAEIFKTEFVPEVAREFISSNDFTVQDIIAIAHAQTARIVEMTKTASKILFCDTDLITTAIYSHHYLGKAPDVLYELEKEVKFDRYFFVRHRCSLGGRRFA